MLKNNSFIRRTSSANTRPTLSAQEVVDLISTWLDDLASWVEERKNEMHAQMILTGLSSNRNAKNLLVLFATLDPFTLESAIPLSGLGGNYLQKLYDAFYDCGALLPVLEPLQDENLYNNVVNAIINHVGPHGEILDGFDSSRELVAYYVREECQSEVNPAVRALLRQEMSP